MVEITDVSGIWNKYWDGRVCFASEETETGIQKLYRVQKSWAESN